MLNYVTLLNKSTVYSDYLGENILSLLDQTYAVPDTFSFNLFNVEDEQYIARPDLISLDAYGDDMYADVICKLNGISNPFELNVGMVLLLPSPENIRDFHVKPLSKVLAAEKEIGNDTEFALPQAKSKTDRKRKPNEAIIGSSRFKIDQSSGIIIY